MTDVERPCRNTVNKSLLLLFFINILQAVVPKKKRKRKRTYNCFDNALMGNHSLLTDPLFSLQSPSGSRATLINEYFILHRSLIRPLESAATRKSKR